MKPLLKLKNFSVSYGKKETVHGVDLELAEGEFCALLGLNGSGKTTLLRGVCGLLPHISGECRILEEDCLRLHEYQRAKKMSFIPQVSSEIDGITVLEVVLMGCNPYLHLFESPGAGQRAQAVQILEKLGLIQWKDKEFSILSQGQKQLVILARTLMQDTPVLLMDEPDSALDFCNRHMVLGKIRDTVHEEKKAGLITLHDPNFAMNYCDRLVLLRDGRICGEIHMQGATEEEIRGKLSGIYGDVEIVPQGSAWLMGKA